MSVETGSEQQINMVNHTTFSSRELAKDPQIRELSLHLSKWIDNARAATQRNSMFDRGAYVPPDNPYDEMRASKHALKYDSIVSGVAEITESLAFVGLKWEGEDPDEADVFNQWSRDVNLDQVIRSMWREEFAISQSVCSKIWNWKTYTVRGKTTKGNARKKTYRVWCPISMRTINPARCVPIDLGPLGGTRLAWASNTEEVGYYEQCYRGDRIDPLMLAFFTGTYFPPVEDIQILTSWNVDIHHLLLMDPEWVFRHTTTKSDYEPFPEPRIKSCFPLLDMKTHLLAADRAALVGNANFILLVKQGDKDLPGKAEEIQNLRQNFNVVSRSSVIISDHRLNIEIIAPKTDLTLIGEKYEVLNNQLLNRLLGTLTVGGRGQRNETQVTLSEIVARVLENRRHMLKRTIEREVARAIVEHPKNAGLFNSEPNLVFTPRNISLELSQSVMQTLLALRSSREISRETMLESLGLDEATEAQRMQYEEDFFDDIFKTVLQPGQVPGGGPNGAGDPPGVSGAKGGRPVGGGSTPNNPVKKAAPKTPSGNKSTKASQDDDETPIE